MSYGDSACTYTDVIMDALDGWMMVMDYYNIPLALDVHANIILLTLWWEIFADFKFGLTSTKIKTAN